MLEHAAAGKWGVLEEECQDQNHFVVQTKTGRKLSYGEHVPLASASTAPTQKAFWVKNNSATTSSMTDLTCGSRRGARPPPIGVPQDDGSNITPALNHLW